MSLPPWVVITALLFGLSGMACLIWGLFKNQKYAVWIGHFMVSSHVGMYFWGMGGWFIGLGTVSFATAGYISVFHGPVDRSPVGWRNVDYMIFFNTL